MEDSVEIIDQPIMKLVKTQSIYWVNVLYPVVGILKDMFCHNYPLKGTHLSFKDNSGDDDKEDHKDSYGSKINGNFISELKLIASNNPFLDKHIKEFSNEGLSFTMFLDLMKLMEQKVYDAIIEEIKTAKYFSIIIEHTPNIYPNIGSSFIFRYVQDGIPVERFLCFLQNIDNKTEDLASEVFNILQVNNLDINNCRGFGYDNTSHMLGKCLALQTRIQESCTYAVYIPYCVHSLNLVCERFVEYYYKECTYFIHIEELFKLFSLTFYWQKLTECSTKNISNKTMPNKRWSNHDDACHSLSQNWTEVIETLYKISKTKKIEHKQLSNMAQNLLDKLQSLEMCIIVSVWSDVLKQINLTSKNLKEIPWDIKSTISEYCVLIQYISDLKDKFDHYETKCIVKSGINEYSTEDWMNRGRKRKLSEGETSEHNLREVFKTQVFVPILDPLITELNKIKFVYSEMNNKFGFLFRLTDMTSFEVTDKAESLQKYYHNDLSTEYFVKECVNLHRVLPNTSTDFPKTILEIYQKLLTIGILNVFPEINIAFKMILCNPAFNLSSIRLNDVLWKNTITINDEIDDEFEILRFVGYSDEDEDIRAGAEDRLEFVYNREDEDVDMHVDDNNVADDDNNLGDNNTLDDNAHDNVIDEMNILERIKKFLKIGSLGEFHNNQDYQPILYIESDLTNNLHFDDIIEQFSESLAEKYNN